MKKNIKNLNNELERLNKILEEKDTQIQELDDELKEVNSEYQKIINENEKIKSDVSYLEKRLEEYEKEIEIYKNEKNNDETNIKQLNQDIESYKNVIIQYKEEITCYNSELDQYENETKAMDAEIKTLNEKILQLNITIENLKNKLKEYETNKDSKPIKSINEQFCELIHNFCRKKIVKNEIDMIIGVHLARQEKKFEKKYNNMVDIHNRLKKRISDLTGQINILKYGKNMTIDLEEQKNDIEVNDIKDDEIDNKTQIKTSKCSTFQKYRNRNIYKTVEVEITEKKSVETVAPAKNYQISYKRKKGGNNQ